MPSNPAGMWGIKETKEGRKKRNPQIFLTQSGCGEESCPQDLHIAKSWALLGENLELATRWDNSDPLGVSRSLRSSEAWWTAHAGMMEHGTVVK